MVNELQENRPLSGITMERIGQIPMPWSETFTRADLPSRASILTAVHKTHPTDWNEKGKIQRAKEDPNYIGLTDEQLEDMIPPFVDSLLEEMYEYETIGRESAEIRLAKLKEIAPSIKYIIDRSAPGDYYHLNKSDKYQNDPAMQGGDRLRSDQAAILAIVLAGIKQRWPDSELLLFLRQHILVNDNEELNKLREKAKRAIIESGIRLVYSGEEYEEQPIRRVLNQRNVFIPKECVDFIDPTKIKDTYSQAVEFKEFLKTLLQPGDSIIEPINLQGIRSNRNAKKADMIPEGTNYYIYAIPTIKAEKSLPYREGEIRGTIRYALAGTADFKPVPHTII